MKHNVFMLGAIFIFLSGCEISSKNLISMDEIVKLISHFYENSHISILGETDIDLNTKLIFLEVDKQRGFSVFEQDNLKSSALNNYLFDSTKPFSGQLVPYNQPDEFLYIVYSDGSELTKVQLTINNDKIQTKEVILNEPSLTIFNLNLPPGTTHFTLDRVYYGIIGEEIQFND